MKRVVQREKGHECLICGSLIQKKNDMRRHMFDRHVNAGVRYWCPLCDSILSSRNSMRVHLRRKHGEISCWTGLEKYAVVEEKEEHPGEEDENAR